MECQIGLTNTGRRHLTLLCMSANALANDSTHYKTRDLLTISLAAVSLVRISVC